MSQELQADLCALADEFDRGVAPSQLAAVATVSSSTDANSRQSRTLSSGSSGEGLETPAKTTALAGVVHASKSSTRAVKRSPSGFLDDLDGDNLMSALRQFEVKLTQEISMSQDFRLSQ